MKKKTAPKRSSTRKTVKRTVPRSSSSQTLLFRRIVIISACFVLVVGIAATFNRGAASRAVAGVSMTRGLFMQTTVRLPQVYGANYYNVYYRQLGEQNYTNAVRNIPANNTTYLISFLKKGVTYQYTVATVINGTEVSFTPVKTFTNLQQM